ncbi:8660_t:CDS:2 [Cetraspora pellucida]|uniref:8660_t:CDS:1 n=1 Tax=Cetraspora pellucida TaxID=1433469 RepID=A0ACA9NRC8_9GLOM|nr:8660_t:CDS:2 [Cetraspora pellucida]
MPVEPTPCPFTRESSIVRQATIAYEQIIEAVDRDDRIESLSFPATWREAALLHQLDYPYKDSSTVYRRVPITVAINFSWNSNIRMGEL